MPLATRLILPPSSPTPSPSALPLANGPLSRPRGRPKGLWKARVTFTVTHSSTPTSSEDDADSVLGPEHSYPNKKRRLEEEDKIEEQSAIPSPPPSPATSCCPAESELVSRARIMDISSVAANTNGNGRPAPPFNYEDWEDLKDLFSSAAQQYETAEPSEALPLIRGVIHECHRFQKDYQDPSTLFANPTAIATASTSSSRPHTPPERHNTNTTTRRRTHTASRSDTHSSHYTYHPPERKKCTCRELPTSFHAIFGTALFLFGNLIAQDPSLTLPGEPNSPMAYWTAAIDVFETGENLPTRTHGFNACDAPEDWRMAIVWGRTLVCLADERVTGMHDGDEPTSEPSHTNGINGTGGEDTPFSIIAQRRPPLTNRTSLTTASPTELLKLAMDQFSRGIFHMPHPEQQATPASCSSGSSLSEDLNFSRAKELYTLASEVLLVSEKLPQASDRRYWASWADSIFNQMQMEKGGRTVTKEGSCDYRVDFARGRCCLIVGSAIAEGIEDALEQEDAASVLDGEEAEEAREYLSEAVAFFDKARVRGQARQAKPKEKEKKREKNGTSSSSKKRKRERDDVGGGDEDSPPLSKSKVATGLPIPPSSSVPSTPMYTPVMSPSGTSPNSYFPPPSTVSSEEDEEEEEEMQNEDSEEEEEGEQDELGDLLAEALLTLANLTKDEKKQEELYARAERESGRSLSLEEGS